MQTLAEALETRLRQAALVGWRIGARKLIEIVADSATLTLGWIDDRGLSAAEPGARKIADHVVNIDLDGLPPGVTAIEWDALPDTRDLIAVPTEAEIKAAARRLDCKWVDRGNADNLLIYWIR